MGVGGPTFHGFSGIGIGGWIDYIFASHSIEVLEAEIIRQTVEGRYPSDHFRSGPGYVCHIDLNSPAFKVLDVVVRNAVVGNYDVNLF